MTGSVTAAAAGEWQGARVRDRLRGAGRGVRPALHDRRPGRDRHRAGRVVAVADAHQVTPAQVRLAWTLQCGPHVLVIPGTGNPDHLAVNIAAGALRLSEAEMTSLTFANLA